MKKINVLIFPASGENSYEIYDSLKTCVNINVFGATSKKDYSRFLYSNNSLFIDNYNINEPDFWNNFNNLLLKNKIDVVIPTHDTIAYFLSKNKEKLKAKLLTADEKTSYICRHKIETFKLFKDESFCPKFYYDLDIPNEYPAFAKPNIGAGAQGVKIIKSRDEYLEFIKLNHDYVTCEYLPGEEYTIDCFTNKHGELLFVGARTRERITMGISFASKSLECPEEIKKIAEIINSKTKMFGAWFFQLKRDKQGKLKLLEIACRQAGTMNLYRNKGINFALCGVYELMGIDVEIIENKFTIELERRLEAQYDFDYSYNSVYIDYDDTLIINNQVNLDAIQYLYYCLNKNINIYLISKHIGNIYEDLEKYNISSSLFTKIFILEETQNKYDFIEDERSIFIDNSYKERIKIYKEKQIPVFDVDAIKSLIKLN